MSSSRKSKTLSNLQLPNVQLSNIDLATPLLSTSVPTIGFIKPTLSINKFIQAALPILPSIQPLQGNVNTLTQANIPQYDPINATIPSCIQGKTASQPVNIVIKTCKNITSRQALLMIPITKFFSTQYNLNKLIEILKGESISLRLIDWFVTNYCKKYNIIYNMGEYADQHIQHIQHDHPDQSNTSSSSPLNNLLIMNENTNTNTNTNQCIQNHPAKASLDKPSFDNFIIVHNNYKGQLKAYSKRNFDPFCRRNRIRFYYDDNKYFITTVGQLNFFKWALESNLINYTAKHFRVIDDDMNNRGEIAIRKSANITQQTGDTTKKKKHTDGSIPIETAIKTKKNGGTRKKRTEISSSASKSISIYNYPTTLNFD
uniref:Uncharacterized protein n=1 Tax=viral metagenome TaxID=1070528 RepID=A0A6C0HM70_9ZZZZ